MSKFHTILFFLTTVIFVADLSGQEVTRIKMLGADVLTQGRSDTGTYTRLIGNVRFLHENTYMRCDSAWFFKELNIVDAFGNVLIRKGDSIRIYGDRLHYNGNTEKSFLSGNVLLLEQDMQLNTEFLRYDMSKGVGIYDRGAVIQNEGTTLTSVKGYYYSDTKNAYFKEDVTLETADYILYSDTFMYNIETEITYFFGPTEIISDENYIYCEGGWYDNASNEAFFTKNVYLEHGSEEIRADTLFYDRNTGYGEAFSNITFRDTARNMIIDSDHANYWENDQLVIATRNAILTNIIDQDSLFIHGDTLRAFTDTATGTQSFLAFGDVRFYKSTLQGVCDSLAYNDQDSILHLYDDPVLWSENNQFSADTIEVLFENKKIHRLNLYQNAFLASMEDSLVYNQITGRHIYGFFRDDTLRNMEVLGNAQSIYYVVDENGGYVGVNEALCSNIYIFLKDNKVNRTTCVGQPEGTMHPIQQVNVRDFILESFVWRGQHRPVSRDDLL